MSGSGIASVFSALPLAALATQPSPTEQATPLVGAAILVANAAELVADGRPRSRKTEPVASAQLGLGEAQWSQGSRGQETPTKGKPRQPIPAAPVELARPASRGRPLAVCLEGDATGAGAPAPSSRGRGVPLVTEGLPVPPAPPRPGAAARGVPASPRICELTGSWPGEALPQAPKPEYRQCAAVDCSGSVLLEDLPEAAQAVKDPSSWPRRGGAVERSVAEAQVAPSFDDFSHAPPAPAANGGRGHGGSPFGVLPDAGGVRAVAAPPDGGRQKSRGSAGIGPDLGAHINGNAAGDVENDAAVATSTSGKARRSRVKRAEDIGSIWTSQGNVVGTEGRKGGLVRGQRDYSTAPEADSGGTVASLKSRHRTFETNLAQDFLDLFARA